MLMIGDGALALTQPHRHTRLWNTGPDAWRAMVSFFEERPLLTMAVGAASIAGGFWLASTLRGEEEDAHQPERKTRPSGAISAPHPSGVYPLNCPS
jgi:hypothetical protein